MHLKHRNDHDAVTIPEIFGIVNLTPDSFSDGNKYPDVQTAVADALRMFEQGAAGVDIGAESTRPGAGEIPAAIQIQRLIPVINGILEQYQDAMISVDTRSAEVAEAALKAGAAIINDVSGLTYDPDMRKVVAEYHAPTVIMHMRGTPETMRKIPELMQYDNLIDDVAEELLHLAEKAISNGISRDSILLDPGLGFAKTPEQDMELIRKAGELRQKTGFPLFYGPSRKSFMQKYISHPLPPTERDHATAGILCALCNAGVEYVRVHNVKMAQECMTLFHAAQSR